MKYRYRAYNMSIGSTLQLPELLPDREPDGTEQVSIAYADTDFPPHPQGRQISPFVWVDDNAFSLQVPGVARFRVTAGRHITVSPEPGIDDASVRVFLLGSALGALLFQRGLLLLHGNAIDIDGNCLICLGPSGVGKSTLAAAFVQRGYRMLADDVVAIDADCAAVPGFPRLKLWQDSAEKLRLDTGNRNRIRPEMNKFNIPTVDQFCDRALPVRWIYVLDSDNRDGIRISTLKGMDRFQPLRSNTYRRRFMEGMALRPEHLTRCGELAGKVHLAKVVRSKTGFEVDRLIDCLLEDMMAVE